MSLENKSKTRFDKFQTMSEAKFALKLVFEQAAEMQKEKVQTQLKLNELQDSFNEVYQWTIIKLRECKISFLLVAGKNEYVRSKIQT